MCVTDAFNYTSGTIFNEGAIDNILSDLNEVALVALFCGSGSVFPVTLVYH